MLIYGFNDAHNNMATSYLKVGDDSKSKIRFWTMAKDNLPHLPYIFLKPEPPSKEFNKITCYFTGYFLFIKVRRGKKGIKNSKYYLQLGSTEEFTKRMAEST